MNTFKALAKAALFTALGIVGATITLNLAEQFRGKKSS